MKFVRGYPFNRIFTEPTKPEETTPAAVGETVVPYLEKKPEVAPSQEELIIEPSSESLEKEAVKEEVKDDGVEVSLVSADAPVADGTTPDQTLIDDPLINPDEVSEEDPLTALKERFAIPELSQEPEEVKSEYAIPSDRVAETAEEVEQPASVPEPEPTPDTVPTTPPEPEQVEPIQELEVALDETVEAVDSVPEPVEEEAEPEWTGNCEVCKAPTHLCECTAEQELAELEAASEAVVDETWNKFVDAVILPVLNTCADRFKDFINEELANDLKSKQPKIEE